MLQLVVLWHVVSKLPRELFNLCGQLQLFYQATRVLFELFGLDLLVSVQLIDALVELLDFLSTFLVLSRPIVL